jgi:DNA-directed RNA polymerase subunit F
MKKVIRLSERDLTKLIKRMIKEMEDPSTFEDADRNYEEKMSVNDVANIFSEVSSLPKSAVSELKKIVSNEIADLTPEEKEELKSLVNQGMSGEMMEEDDLSSRKSRFKEKAMMRGGVGMMGSGLLGLISQGMGYTDYGDTWVAIHDYVEKMGGAPVSALALIGGIIIALKGMANRDLRTNR